MASKRSPRDGVEKTKNAEAISCPTFPNLSQKMKNMHLPSVLVAFQLLPVEIFQREERQAQGWMATNDSMSESQWSFIDGPGLDCDGPAMVRKVLEPA
ncbi:unnamed protein product [Victoria cruziana]